MEHLMGESVEKRRPIVAGKEGRLENGCFVLDLAGRIWRILGTTCSKFSSFYLQRCIFLDETRNGGAKRENICSAAEGQSCLILVSDIENSLHEFRKLPRFRANKEPNRRRRERRSQLETSKFSRWKILYAVYFTRYWLVERFYFANEIGNGVPLLVR